MQSNFHEIRKILFNNSIARDDWVLTIQILHQQQMKELGISKANYFEHLYEHKTFSDHCTLRRTWQKVQEEYPNLRGVNWIKRQKFGKNFSPSMIMDENQMRLF